MRRWLADKIIGFGVWLLGDVTETPPVLPPRQAESDDGAIPYPPARLTPTGAKMLLEGAEPVPEKEEEPDGPLPGTREYRVMQAQLRARTEMG